MSKDPFHWLEQEVAEVKTAKFFGFDPLSADEMASVEHHSPQLPADYLAFVHRFGFARLYRQHVGYALGVRGVPTRVTSASKEEPIDIGHYLDQTAYFKGKMLRRNGNSPVFEASSSKLVRCADSFAEWLKARAAEARAALGSKKWAEIVRGPRPFTAKEQQVLDARAKFRWRALEAAEDGDAQIEVGNDSTRRLPFFTLGVRDSRGGFDGRVWLPVKHIKPGSVQVVRHDAYKEYIPQQFREFFEVGPPGPEDREHYWEFRA